MAKLIKKYILRLTPDQVVMDVNKNNRRYHDIDIEDMTMQLLEAGKLLQPLGVSGPFKTGENKGKYRLDFGFRRFQAMSDIINGGLAVGTPGEEELSAIDCTLLSEDATDDKASYIANLAENFDRKSSTPMDESVALNTLIDEFGLTNAEAAKQLRMKPSLASQRKPLAKLPVCIHRYINDGVISASVGYELSKEPADKVQEIAERLVAEAKAAGKSRVSRDQMSDATREARAEETGAEAGDGEAAAGGTEDTSQTPTPGKKARTPLKARSVKAALNFLSIYKLTDIKSEKGTKQLVVEFLERVFQGVDEKKLKKEFDAILSD